MKTKALIIALVIMNLLLLYRINTAVVGKMEKSNPVSFFNSNDNFLIRFTRSDIAGPRILIYLTDDGCRSCKESIIRNLESMDKKYRKNIKILYAGNFREDKLFTNFRKNLLVSKELSSYLEKNLNSTPAILFINTRGEVIFSYAPAPGASKEIDIFFKSLKKILYDFGFGQ